jgi:dihydrofolate synthase/folylpolyglutamate synthase
MTGHPFERLSYDLKYDQALAYLYNLQKFGIKFGLSKTQNLLKAFGQPQKGLKLIHIAGSNGKGSVAAMVSSIYGQAGYKVGLFTSPHLTDFRERFRINGRMISKKQTRELIKEIREKTDPKEPPTFFEFVTAMALLYFYREKVDLAVLEVGLGGRLDATNVIRPMITVITTISLEHREYLGNTLEKIALEKGGIIKPRIPLVTGVSQRKVQDILEGICREKQAPMLLAGRDFRTGNLRDGRFSYFGFRISDFGIENPSTPHSVIRNPHLPPSPVTRHPSLRVGLLGDHQIKNAGLALTVVGWLQKRFPVPEEKIRDGLSKVIWPGRLEVLAERPMIVLDGAHNPGAMKVLAQNLPRVFSHKRLWLVIGMMKDKDIKKTLDHIVPLADVIFLTRAEYDRSADPENLKAFLKDKSRSIRISKDIPTAVQQAREEAAPEDLILITGSLFVVGEAKAWWETQRSPSKGSRAEGSSERPGN